MTMDIEANRKSEKYSNGELVGRFLWALCSPLFRWSPRLCWGWRRFMLRLFGAKVGAQVHIHPSAQIFHDLAAGAFVWGHAQVPRNLHAIGAGRDHSG
jgi:hypothetical protein